LRTRVRGSVRPIVAWLSIAGRVFLRPFRFPLFPMTAVFLIARGANQKSRVFTLPDPLQQTLPPGMQTLGVWDALGLLLLLPFVQHRPRTHRRPAASPRLPPRRPLPVQARLCGTKSAPCFRQDSHSPTNLFFPVIRTCKKMMRRENPFAACDRPFDTHGCLRALPLRTLLWAPTSANFVFRSPCYLFIFFF